jgi:peptidyl-prolyl cis-trans isomerase-like protein 2
MSRKVSASAKAISADEPQSMANSGPRSNTSQFFITFRETPHLNGGEEVLDRIERITVRPGGDRPAKDITITGVQV